ncbi:MAG: VIT1/CCC1 transporter family protein [Chloroflexi bacterium]|nr:VIT1/CCC1 transporter family protein [Chloroflexota bacterium]
MRRKRGQREQDGRETYLGYLHNELESVDLYNALAAIEKDLERAKLFRNLAQAEMRHVRVWAGKLEIEAPSPEDWPRTLRVRVLCMIARVFGTRAVMPLILKSEVADVDTYRADPTASSIVEGEIEHFQTLGRLAGKTDYAQIISLERRHYSGTANVRAGVLGFNDGLVSNLSLVMGVAGATTETSFIVLAGVSGLLAGAFSMAAGEYVSVRAQRDIYEKEIEVERAELEEFPEEERHELALIYQSKGFTREEARAVAERIMSDPKVALETLAREELGLDPSQLGSPWMATISSFIAFGLGALIPVLPHIVTDGVVAFSLSLGLSGLMTVAIGILLGVITGKNPVWSGGRMLLVAAAAASVTFGIGSAIGLTLD